MNILVLGSGGREHAIRGRWPHRREPTRSLAPGNGGTDSLAVNVDIDMMDAQAVLDFVRERQIGLVVIGPEAPLVKGVADVLREAGVAVFGPNADGAQLEGSKSYSKKFMLENGIPTAAYAVFDAEEPALAYVCASKVRRSSSKRTALLRVKASSSPRRSRTPRKPFARASTARSVPPARRWSSRSA